MTVILNATVIFDANRSAHTRTQSGIHMISLMI